MLPQFISRLFQGNITNADENYIIVQLNDKVVPIHKEAVYIEPLHDMLRNKKYGTISGGGTLKENMGEIVFCDIQIELCCVLTNQIIHDIINTLEDCGAPKGSKLIIEETHQEIPFGINEGIAVYLNTENFQKETGEPHNIDFVQSEIARLTNMELSAHRHWKGESATGLYFYGQSFSRMKKDIVHFMSTHPVCKGATIAQIA